LTISAGLGIIALTVAATVLALRSSQPAPVISQPPSNPPISIVVNLAQPAPTPATAVLPHGTTPITQTLTANVVNLPAEQPNADPSVPIVRVDQISNPGATHRPAFVPQTTAPTATYAALQNQQAPVTYQQMFQEIALRYDLNWRVLAAQAYIESGFDSLALGKQGDMGLMQILPATWHEWAPVVNASDPFDSYSNVLVGAVYLDHLRSELCKKGYPQTEWMLVAYNWGIDKVLDHLAAGQGWEDLPANRRQYALDILRVAETIPPG
jgi:soluble lytic murein transglycosylase-like protein